MIKVNEDYEELQKLVESCAYFVKKYKPVLKAEEKRRENIKILQEDVKKWLEKAKPGDEYPMPKLKLKKEDICMTLYKTTGVDMSCKIINGESCYTWIKPGAEEEPLPF